MGKQWDDLKKKGNPIYKTGGIEPIDLYKEGGILWNWCIGEIIAKAYRNRVLLSDVTAPFTRPSSAKILEDLDEIIHHAEMLKVVVEEAVVRVMA